MFAVGQLVAVAPRTWPGINQAGGVGRLTGISADGERVSVRYVLDGRHEKEIEVVHVKVHEQSGERSLRDRSMLIGRCNRCGSLRRDCGFCENHVQWVSAVETAVQARRRKPVAGNDGEDDDDLASEGSWAQATRTVKARFKRLRKKQLLPDEDDDDGRSSHVSHMSTDSQSGSDDDDESISSGDDILLDKLMKAQYSKSLGNRLQRLKRWRHPLHNQKSVLETLDGECTPRGRVVRSRKERQQPIENDENHINGEDAVTERAKKSTTSVLETVDGMKLVDTPEKRDDIGMVDDGSPNNFGEHDLESGQISTQELQLDSSDEIFGTSNDHAPLSDEGLKYLGLPGFVDSLLDNLEGDQVPQARQGVLELEREVKLRPSSCTLEDLHALGRKCDSLYEKLILNLIREGIDKCQAALNKLSSRRLYRQHKGRMSAGQAEEFKSSKLDLRDMRADSLGQSIERIMKKLRVLQSDLDFHVEKLCDEADADSSLEGVSQNDDEFVYPDLPSPSPPNTSRRTTLQTSAHSYAQLRRKPKPPGPEISHSKGKWGTRQKQTNRDASTRATTAKRNTSRSRSHASNKLKHPVSARNGESRLRERSAAGSKRVRRGAKKRKRNGNPVKDSEQTIPTGRLRSDNYRTTSSNSEDGAQSNLVGNGLSVADVAFAVVKNSVLVNNHPASKENDFVTRVENFFSSREENSDQPSHVPALARSNLQQNECTGYESPTSDRDDGYAHALVRSPVSPDSSSSLQSCLGSASCDRSSANEATPAYVDDYCSNVLRECSTKTRDYPETFKTLHGFILTFKCPTLQELIAKSSRRLSSFCNTLVVLLTLIHENKNQHLEEDHGLCHELFGPIGATHFRDLVTYQMVEALVSMTIPSAWGICAPAVRLAHDSIVSIARTLGKFSSVMEETAKVLTQALQPQRWRLSDDGTFAYITCTDAEAWARFLRSASMPPFKSPESRYSLIGPRLPRCEIESIWCLLAIVAGVETANESDRLCTWKLIGRILDEGVLEESTFAPPRWLQLITCAEQINMLNSLLIKGCLNGSRFDDSLLLTTVARAVRMEASGIRYNERSRVALYPSTTNCNADKKILELAWTNCEAGRSGVVFAHRQFLVDLHQGGLSSVFMGIPLLLPASSILGACLSMISLWVETTPAQKSRQKRLTKNLVTIADKLLSPTDNIPNWEPQTFQTTDRTKGGLGHDRAQLFLAEACVSIKLVYRVATKANFGSVHLAQSWESLANRSMCERLRSLAGGSACGSTVLDYDGDALRLLVTSRVCTVNAMLVQGSSPNVNPASASTDQNVFDDALLRILTCLDCATCSRINTEVTCGIVVHIVSLLTQSPTRCMGDLARFHFLRCSCKLLQLLFSASFCGEEDDLCIDALLLALHETIKNSPPCQPQEPSSIPSSSKFLIEVFSVLASGLFEAKPSLRFSPIERRSSSTGIANIISQHGRMLVARHTKRICQVLVRMATVECPSSSLLQKFAQFCKGIACSNLAEYTVDDDSDYFGLIVAQVVSGGSRVFAGKKLQQKILTDVVDGFLARGIESIFEDKTLLSMPSANFLRIRENGGTELAAIELERCNRIPQSFKSSSLHFFTSLSTLVDNPGSANSFIQEVFQVLAEPLPKSSMVQSLERECFHRFVLLKRLVEVAINDGGELATNLVGVIFKLVQHNLLKINEMFLNGVRSSSEFFLAWAEFQVAVVAMTTEICCNRKQFPLLETIWKSLLCPALLEKEICSVDRTDSSLCLANIVLRFSRCWIVSAAKDFRTGGVWHTECLYQALIHGAIRRGEQACALLSNAFFAWSWSAENLGNHFVSPLSLALFDLFESDENDSCHRQVNDALLSLQKHTVFQVLAPLLSKGSGLVAVNALIRELLDIEVQGPVAKTSGKPKLDVQEICKLLRQLLAGIDATVESRPLDHDLLRSSLVLLSSVMSLPASLVEPSAIGWLLDWCADTISSPQNDRLHKQAQFISAFSTWLADLGKQLFTQGFYDFSSEKAKLLEASRKALFLHETTARFKSSQGMQPKLVLKDLPPTLIHAIRQVM